MCDNIIGDNEDVTADEFQRWLVPRIDEYRSDSRQDSVQHSSVNHHVYSLTSDPDSHIGRDSLDSIYDSRDLVPAATGNRSGDVDGELSESRIDQFDGSKAGEGTPDEELCGAHLDTDSHVDKIQSDVIEDGRDFIPTPLEGSTQDSEQINAVVAEASAEVQDAIVMVRQRQGEASPGRDHSGKMVEPSEEEQDRHTSKVRLSMESDSQEIPLSSSNRRSVEVEGFSIRKQHYLAGDREEEDFGHDAWTRTLERGGPIESSMTSLSYQLEGEETPSREAIGSEQLSEGYEDDGDERERKQGSEYRTGKSSYRSGFGNENSGLYFLQPEDHEIGEVDSLHSTLANAHDEEDRYHNSDAYRSAFRSSADRDFGVTSGSEPPEPRTMSAMPRPTTYKSSTSVSVTSSLVTSVPLLLNLTASADSEIRRSNSVQLGVQGKRMPVYVSKNHHGPRTTADLKSIHGKGDNASLVSGKEPVARGRRPVSGYLRGSLYDKSSRTRTSSSGDTPPAPREYLRALSRDKRIYLKPKTKPSSSTTADRNSARSPGLGNDVRSPGRGGRLSSRPRSASSSRLSYLSSASAVTMFERRQGSDTLPERRSLSRERIVQQSQQSTRRASGEQVKSEREMGSGSGSLESSRSESLVGRLNSARERTMYLRPSHQERLNHLAARGDPRRHVPGRAETRDKDSPSVTEAGKGAVGAVHTDHSDESKEERRTVSSAGTVESTRRRRRNGSRGDKANQVNVGNGLHSEPTNGPEPTSGEGVAFEWRGLAHEKRLNALEESHGILMRNNQVSIFATVISPQRIICNYSIPPLEFTSFTKNVLLPDTKQVLQQGQRLLQRRVTEVCSIALKSIRRQVFVIYCSESILCSN